VIEKLLSSSSKENGSNVISKDNHGKLSWNHRHVLVSDFLDHVDTVWAECCGTLSLWWPFLQKASVLHQSIVLLHENARHHTPNWTAVYSCTTDTLRISPNLVLSVLFLTESLRSTWLASDFNRCRCEASYHLLATDT